MGSRSCFIGASESKNSNAELDYVEEHNGQVVPIEVKTGSGSSLRSMLIFLEEKQREVGLRFNADRPITQTLMVGKRRVTLVSRPLYLAGSWEDLETQPEPNGT